MIRRAALALLSAALIVAGLLVGAPTASAASASPSSVTVSGASSPFSLSSSALTAQVGDTFSITNSAGNAGSFISVKGSLTRSRDSTDCSATSPYCTLGNGNSDTYTIDALGTVEVYVYPGGALGALIGTITIGSGTDTSATSTDPALVYPTVTFDPLGGTCTVPLSITNENGSNSTYTMPTGDQCTRANYRLVGWMNAAPDADGRPRAGTTTYGPSFVANLTDSLTLYAEWAPASGKVKVRYDANVGTDAECLADGVNQTARPQQTEFTLVDIGSASATSAPCTPPGHILAGWARSGNRDNFDAGGALPSNLNGTTVTLYAKWTVPPRPAEKTITINGERGTVKGKPGITVEGVTTGFSEGDKVVPYIKFPGQTSYSEGIARPTVDAEGEFSWQRKTGKKIYVYVEIEGSDVRSNRVVIPAK